MKNACSLVVLLFALVICPSCTPTRPEIGALIWHGDLSSKNVYLTFDDGPSNEATVEILDMLKANDAKATFFMLGKRAEKNPEVVRRIYNEGHSLGNHTYSHVGGRNTNWTKITNEISRTDAAIKKACGHSPRFFRPPFGFFNFRYFKVAEKMGYTSILWTLDASDWSRAVTTRDIEKRIIPAVKGGYIVLLHDGGPNRGPLLEALPKILRELKKKGFEFRPLSEL